MGQGHVCQTLSNAVDASYQSFASSQHSTHPICNRESTLLPGANVPSIALTSRPRKIPIPSNYTLPHTPTTSQHGAKKTKIKALEQGPFSPRSYGKPYDTSLYSRDYCYYHRDYGFKFDQCCCKPSEQETAISRGRDSEVYSKLKINLWQYLGQFS